MLKQFSILTIGLLVILVAPATVSAFSLGVDYTESVVVSDINTPGYNYVSTVDFYSGHGFVGFLNTESWLHSLSADFMPVPDAFTVTSAKLEISGYRYFGLGVDVVQFAGTCNWTASDGWRWIGRSENSFDLTNIESRYWNSDPLYVSITPVFDLGLNLERSVLSIDYASVDQLAPAAVPEPFTFVTLGLGLVGLWRHRRSTK